MTSIIPHEFFPRSMFDMNTWMRLPLMTPPLVPPSLIPSVLGITSAKIPAALSTLDLFDPFDELDNVISRNVHWLNKPEFLGSLPLYPRVPQKYRVSVDCAGYSPSSIKTEMKPDNKLVVSAREEQRTEAEGDFSVREFKRTYQLPPQAEPDKLISFMTGNDRLVIEVPLKETEISRDSDLFPRIIDNPDGTKSVSMRFNVPEDVDVNKMNVSVKDRDLIVRVEDKVDKADRHTRFHYYKRTTLPENTKLDELKCVLDKNTITATAPLDLNFRRPYRTVPIGHGKQTESIEQGEEKTEPAAKQQPQTKKQEKQQQKPGQTQTEKTQEP